MEEQLKMFLYLRKSLILPFMVLASIYGCTGKNEADFSRSTPWALTGAWLVGDLHTHSRFSDGALSAADLIKLAVDSECQVLALTDHSDLTDDIATATPEYLSTLDELRQLYPGLILIGGIEWNIPPYEGREHVSLLVDPSIESDILSDFRKQFDSLGRKPGDKRIIAEEALDCDGNQQWG